MNPTATTAWRLAVLMGANSRTYKFALASSLLEHAGQGRSEVVLRDLAESYARVIVEHAEVAPQAPSSLSLGSTDFLALVRRDATESVQQGSPTEALVEVAVRSMPGMVMQKFHNLRGGIEAPHRFYNLRSLGADGVVEFTPALMSIAHTKDYSLTAELDARWRIVETSFQTGVGQSLIAEGFGVDVSLGTLVEKRRRRSVVGLGPAVLGFQHGRCLICDNPIADADRTAIDHVFPFSLMRHGRLLAEPGVDLDALWNLTPAHAECNGRKSDRPPTTLEVARLGQRNEAIMLSPHPLRRTLEISLSTAGMRWKPGAWHQYLAHVIA